MRRTTAPTGGVIPAQPGPQEAPEATTGAMPGAGRADRPTLRLRGSGEETDDVPHDHRPHQGEDPQGSADPHAVGGPRAAEAPASEGPEDPDDPPRYAPEWLRLR